MRLELKLRFKLIKRALSPDPMLRVTLGAAFQRGIVEAVRTLPKAKPDS